MASGAVVRFAAALSKHSALLLWIILNSVLFWKTYSMYKSKPQHIYLRNILGRGLCASRASAVVLNLSCCLVLLPVCRSLNSVLHHVLPTWVLAFWLQKVKVLHVVCAATIVVGSVVHTVAHVMNAVSFSQFYDHRHPDLNWAEYEEQGAVGMIFTSVAGLTGVAMVLLLVALTVSSLHWVRRSYYNVFWFMHHLFVPFYVLLLVHPLSGIMKELANPASHIPGCRMPANGTTRAGRAEASANIGDDAEECVAAPIFVAMESQGWLWMLVPLLLYSADLVHRLARRSRGRVTVLQVERLPGAAIKLRLQCLGRRLHCRPGQYVLLQCPVISSLEWHPFTIVVCPTDDQPSFTVLIRARGDWTGDLCGRVLVPFSHCQQTVELCRWPSPEPLRFLVDGPFGSPMEGVLRARVAVCIAAGIGVTPFASCFHHLLTSSEHAKPLRLHLVWLTRRGRELAWFAGLLGELEDKWWRANQPDRLQVILHVTGGCSPANLRNMLGEEHKQFLFRVVGGRPKWPHLFQQWTSIYKRQHISVFTCGPKSLTREISRHCADHSHRGTSITFVHEVFS